MKGRKKVPDELKRMKGTDQPCRMNPNQPKPQIILDISGAECPEHLRDDKVAVDTWNHVIPILSQMRILTVADLLVVAHFCEIESDLRELRANLKKHGRIAYTQKMDSLGNEVIEAKSNPAAVQYKNLMTDYMRLSAELGFTPASRPRLKMAEPTKKDDLEEFIGG